MEDNSYIIKNYLTDFRKHQSIVLNIILSELEKKIIKQYKKYDNIPKGIFLPIESYDDKIFINKIIYLQNFVIYPNINNDLIENVYTIGLWYYWGLPELNFNFNPFIKKENINIIYSLIQKIHLFFFIKYKDQIITKNKKKINRNNIDKIINFNFQEFKLTFHNEEEILNKSYYYLFWFYTYFMISEKNEKDEIKLFNTFSITIDDKIFNKIKNNIETINFINITETNN